MSKYNQTADLKCHKCQTTWLAACLIEPHINYYEVKDEDAFCPKCGHEDENSHDCATCEEAKEEERRQEEKALSRYLNAGWACD